MLYRHLLRHQWKWLVRHPSWTGLGIAYTIFLGLLLLYFTLVFAVLGAFLGEIVNSQTPEADVVGLLHRHLLTAFVFLLFIRFIFQNSPQLHIGPYLHLPVPRPALIRFFTLFSLVHLQNLFPLTFFLPFWVRNVLFDYSAPTALAWLAGVAAIITLSNFLTLWTRLTFVQRPLISWLVGGGLTLLFSLDYWYEWGYAGAFSNTLFNTLLQPTGPLVAFALIASAAVLFALTCRLLGHHLHDEARPGELSATWSRGLLDRLDNMGSVGRLITLDIKLAMRNRRTRQVAWSPLIMVPAGLYYCLGPLYQDSPAGLGQADTYMAILGCLLIGTGFLINYGQFTFGWESHYFDGHLARPLDFRPYLWAKLVPMQISCFVLGLVALPPVLGLGPHLVPALVALTLYNAGFSTACMLLFATFNTKRLDIASSSFFNQQGTSLHHLLVIIPLGAPPMLLTFLLTEQHLLVLGGGGLACLALSPVWVRLLAHRLQKRKYRMAAGFRGTT
ncbi:MAG: hypothetical protein GKR89_24175 [Candidatus Latescibacteria bacterium]|nr:hypothetical protein [Candidatus Latescibacterota bacterium]